MSPKQTNFHFNMSCNFFILKTCLFTKLLLLLFIDSSFSNIEITPNNKSLKSVSNITTSTNSAIINTTLISLIKPTEASGQSHLNHILEKIQPINSTEEKSISTTTFKNTYTTEKTTTSIVQKTKQVRNNIGQAATAPHGPVKIQEKLGAIDCELPILPKESRLWRGNETHELNLPVTMTEDCLTTSGGDMTLSGAEECPPIIVSWEGSADIQSGDILIVRIADSALLESTTQTNIHRNAQAENSTSVVTGERVHRVPPQPAVYQVTRQGHEHCDVTDGMLLDIAPLAENGVKLFTLYDKDLTEGVNLLIVVSDNWGFQCVRLKVTVKSDNCGEAQDCSGRGVCYTNISMEGYECQCCPGYVGPHCEEQDACNPPPCLNNGICVDLAQPINGADYQCLCPYGFNGKRCEKEINPCNSSPCLNGGTCVGSYNSSVYQCGCPEGWSGLNCERPNVGGACASQPCVNGICIEQSETDIQQGSDKYRCFCQPGFAGEHCEYEFNECESSPCANGGTCTDRVGGFLCACGRGYTGKTCQLKVDLCSPNPCPSHRFCIDRGNSYACECPRGFIGDECNMPARSACDNNPCAHGGTCWNGVDSFYCACRPGYTGKLCEEDFILESVIAGGDSSMSEVGKHIGGGSVREVRLPLGLYHDRLHNVYIAAGTLGAAIAIVGIVVTACHCRVNKTYSRFLSRMSRVTDSGPPHHWLQDKRGSTDPAHHSQAYAPYPAAPLDTTDMYYTLDFSDNQSSPLIQ